MKKKLTFCLSCVCVLLALCTVFTLSVLADGSQPDAQNEAVDPFLEAEGDHFISGTCGTNLTWTLNVTTGKMRISGTGAMSFTSSGGYAPWDSYDKLIREVVIEDGVTSIAASAFGDCNFLNLVSLGKNVSSIGTSAFAGCMNLAEVYNASRLTITLHKNENITELGYLGYWAQNVVTPSNAATASRIVRKDGFVFSSNPSGACELLHYEGRDTEITLPSAPIGTRTSYSIATGAFYGESDITSVTIPNCVTSIGANAFYSCGIVTLDIPDSVKTLEGASVIYCPNLIWVRLGAGLTTMGSYSSGGSIVAPFNNCNALIEVCNDSNYEVVAGTRSHGILAEHVYSTDSGSSKLTFDNGFIFFDRDGVNTLLKYVGDADEIVIPDGVEAIKANAFASKTAITKVTVPSSVESMEIEAFTGCSNITEVVIPFTGINRESTYSLSNIFKNSSKIRKVTLTDITEINNNAFYGLASLEEVVFPSDITAVGKEAFYGCKSLKSITLPDSVTSIGLGAFNGCTSLEYLSIPFVGANADHSDKTNFGYIFGAQRTSDHKTSVPATLSTVVITNTDEIAANALINCENIVTVKLPATLTTLGDGAFYNCKSLIEIYNPSEVALELGVEHISNITDYAMVIHTDLNAPSAIIRTEGFAFFTDPLNNETMLLKYTGDATEVVFPATLNGSEYNLVSIKSYAFSGKAQLTSVEIPEGVKEIGEYAFTGCTALKSLSIPSTVEKFYYTSINACNSLEYNVSDGGSYLGSSSSPYHILVSVSNSQTQFTANDNTKIILQRAFYNATSLQSVTIPADVAFVEGLQYSSSSMPISYINAPMCAIEHLPIYNAVTIVISGGTEIPAEAFKNAAKLEAVTIPDSVTSIGQSAFIGCSALKSITLPENVTYLGSNTFRNCTALKSIDLSNITTIGSFCFYGCTSLDNVTLGSGLTEIRQDAFSGCTSLNAVHTDDVQTIFNIDFGSESSNPLFYANTLYINGEKLEELVIPDTVEEIKDYAFTNSDISSVKIPDGITISGKAFSNCQSIVKLSAPADALQYFRLTYIAEVEITSGEIIPYRIFNGCTKLTKVTIGESVNTVSQYAFASCNAIEELYIYSPSVLFESGAFSYAKVSSIFVEDAASWLNMTFADSSANPINGAELYTFENQKIESVSIPEDITAIPDYAFFGCASIKNVEIVGADTTVGSNAFKNVAVENLTVHTSQLSTFTESNGGLKTVEILSGDAIPAYAFAGASSLESIILCDTITSIGNNAFESCSSLLHVNIPNSVTYLGSYVFTDCTSLQSVTLPDTLTTIPERTFNLCESLTSITIPAKVTEIGERAFNSCISLTDIEYAGSALTTIAKRAFNGCTALTEIIIPESVQTIGEYAFNQCTSATSIYIPATASSVSYDAFYNCSNVKSLCASLDHFAELVFPNLEYADFTGGTEVHNSMFYYASAVYSVTLPDTVVSIADYAFKDCINLNNINIPASVVNIGAYAFNGCTALEDVYAESLSSWLSISFLTADSNPLFHAENLYIGDELLEDLVIPDDVTSIGSNVFYGYHALSSVTFHSEVTYVGAGAFYDCTGIKRVDTDSLDSWLDIYFGSLESNPVYYATVLYVDGSLLEDLVIPEGTENIPAYAFAGAHCIKSVIIPASVTNFGNYAFNSCSGIQSMICCSEYYNNLMSCINWNSAYNATRHSFTFEITDSTHYQICTVCSHRENERSHYYSYDPIEYVNATHTEEGFAIYQCECGQTDKRTLPMISHDFSSEIEYVAPSHTEEGKRVFMCDCGQTDTVVLEKTSSHEWDDGSITVEPTHMQSGEMTYSCACGSTYTEALYPLSEHEMGDWSSADEGYHHRTCPCGYYESEVHYFDSEYDDLCDTCGYTREIPPEEEVVQTEIEYETFIEIWTNGAIQNPSEEYFTVVIMPSENENSSSSNTSSGCGSAIGGVSVICLLFTTSAFIFSRKRKDD